MLKGIFYAIPLGFLCVAQSLAQPDTTHQKAPEENRFTVEVLDRKLFEPMEMTVTPDSKIIFVERRGAVKLYSPAAGRTKKLADLPVYIGSEDGLLGVTTDPAFSKNGWIYLFYSPAGEKAVQRVSRFTMVRDSLRLASEKVVLEIPLIRACCHSGGSLTFGPGGNLFISVGDNTNPSASNGFAPIDERPDRLSFDAQKSAANTHDLRGKILRITPRPDGSYTIPDGNLFPKDGSGGRLEIYVMGNRNPFRISVDRQTGYLYWGEVGPDAGIDSLHRGPKGHDEINQARKAGNFGWPYFVGNNKPYRRYDFASRQSGDLFDPLLPENRSVNNTGSKVLPPAQPAFIWYSYLDSPEFPLVQKGGRTAMAGPVFHSTEFRDAPYIFPSYYEGKLLIYDWMRNWLMSVTMNKNGDYESMERLLPSTEFSKPVDMEFGPDGSLYILEYGTFWKSLNDNARLTKIQFHKNNRKPIARIGTDRVEGGLPLKVRFSAKGSFDYDKNDALTYAWKLKNGNIVSKQPIFDFAFTKAGTYEMTLLVTDAHGEHAETSVSIRAGNEPPRVDIETSENKSFYWNDNALQYKVKITDREDGKGEVLDKKAIITFQYLAEGKDLALFSNVDTKAEAFQNTAGRMLAKNGCTACHAFDKRSVGPAFREISQRYKGKTVRNELINKVSAGGNGKWGEVAMAAHPQIDKVEIGQMVDYILGLSDVGETEKLAASGTIKTPGQNSKAGAYYFTASYTDRGANGIQPIKTGASLILRYPLLMAYDCDTSHAVMIRKEDGRARFTKNNAYVNFKNIDLTHVGELSIRAFAYDQIEGTLEIRLGSVEGPVISSRYLNPGSAWTNFDFPFEPVKGFQSLFFVYKTDSKKIGIWQTFDIADIAFIKKPDG